MKNFSLALLFSLVFVSFACLAQDKEYKWGLGVSLNTIERKDPKLDNDNYNTHQNRWIDNDMLQYGFPNSKDNSYSIGLVADYFIESNTSIRLRFGLTKIDKSFHESTTVNGYTNVYDASRQQKDLCFIPGIRWFMNKNVIRFYGGFQVPINLYGKADVYRNDLGTDPSGAFYSLDNVTGTFENGWSVGLGSFAGFQIQYKRFSFGPEFSFAYSRRRYGGKENFLHQVSGISNGTEVKDFDSSFYRYEMSNVEGSLNLSIWF